LAQLRRIYEDSFPDWEREDFDELVRMPARSCFRQLALTDDDTVLGLALLSLLPSVDWWFLGYFAVLAQQRNHGIGTFFWDTIRQQLVEPVVLEIEDVEAPELDVARRRLRQRRLEFWRRQRFDVLSVANYQVPWLTGSGHERMLLMASPAHLLHGPQDLVRLLVALYTEGYSLPEHSPLLAAAIASTTT